MGAAGDMLTAAYNILGMIVDVINGGKTKADAYNDREISIFKQGVIV